jgi:hypothetical protein
VDAQGYVVLVTGAVVVVVVVVGLDVVVLLLVVDEADVAGAVGAVVVGVTGGSVQALPASA